MRQPSSRSELRLNRELDMWLNSGPCARRSHSLTERKCKSPKKGTASNSSSTLEARRHWNNAREILKEAFSRTVHYQSIKWEDRHLKTKPQNSPPVPIQAHWSVKSGERRSLTGRAAKGSGGHLQEGSPQGSWCFPASWGKMQITNKTSRVESEIAHKSKVKQKQANYQLLGKKKSHTTQPTRNRNSI